MHDDVSVRGHRSYACLTDAGITAVTQLRRRAREPLAAAPFGTGHRKTPV